MESNIRALQERQPESEALRRYHELAGWLTGDDKTDARDGVEWVRVLTSDLRIPGLGTYGITAAHLREIVEKAEQASSMKANPIPLTKFELQSTLERSL